MNRRELLKLISLGVVGHTLDIDKLLWVPGEKTYFIPSRGINLNQIIAIEMERLIPTIKTLFERDDTFYRILDKKSIPLISSRKMRVPLSFEGITK